MNEADSKLYTVDKILKAALRKEKAAYNFYDNLLKDGKAEPLREILEQLREEEYRHIRLIEKRIGRLGLD